MILLRLVFGIVAVRILAALVILLAMLQILDLLDVSSDILERGLGLSGLAYYALLRTPRLIEQAMPIAVLVGAIFAFGQIARENAASAMRASGISVYAIVGRALPAALIAVALNAAIGQFVSPSSDAALDAWWKRTTPPSDTAKQPVQTFRVGHDLVSATATASDGSAMADVHIFRRGPEGALEKKLTAATATYVDGQWLLAQANAVTVAADTTSSEQTASLIWDTKLRPADVRSAFGALDAVTTQDARRALGEGASLHAPAFYEMRLQRAWAGPLVSLVMLLLAAPAILVNLRSRGASIVTVGCIALGLLFLVADGILCAIGESGATPVVLAAWGAPFIFTMIASTLLLRGEN